MMNSYYAEQMATARERHMQTRANRAYLVWLFTCEDCTTVRKESLAARVGRRMRRAVTRAVRVSEGLRS